MDQEQRALNLLLVEDNPGDARMVKHILKEAELELDRLEKRDRLRQAIEAQRRDPADVVLLDLNLPDSSGLDTYHEFSQECEGAAVIVLTGLSDTEAALHAVRNGAQDYIVKGEDMRSRLAPAIRYAYERNRQLQQQRELALYDPLTGLYNRRGLFTLGDQQLQLAQRRDTGLSLIYLDLDEFKQVNDRFGHQAGDLLLVTVGDLLQTTFRGSDIHARVGGDEFVVLAIDTGPEDSAIFLERLERGRRRINAAQDLPLRFSAGVAYAEGSDGTDVETLLVQADRMMYIQKSQHRSQASKPKQELP